jgi:16S rRNA (guanine1207-N2)-methyltransferase
VNEPTHYFDPTPEVASRPGTVELVLPDLTVTLASDRGVFSGGQVDPGTKVLLLCAPAPDPEARHVLDLGCGYGAIARTLAHRAPAAHVWAVDVNRRALDLAAHNLDGCDATVALPDDVPDDIAFDVIWSNPPIRIGKTALHAMLLRWLGRLTPTGTAVLVVQKHLGADSLQHWLGDQGHPTTRLASRQAYRLLGIGPRSDAGDR